MGAFEQMHRAIDGLRDLGPIRQRRQAAYERDFASPRQHAHMFRGVFSTFEQALASAPAARLQSYDNSGSAGLYLDRLEVDTYDYPAMVWLARSFQQGLHTVVDFGGSVGIKYFAFRRFMDYPASLRWLVVDMPAVADRGRRFAAEHQVTDTLQFSDQWQSIAQADVLLASGSLQYAPLSLAEMLADSAQRPRRIIVNTTPIHDERSFFTLNNIGTAYCAYRVQARGPFVESISALGYELSDSWSNIGKSMNIPFEPDCGVAAYSGFCFDAIDME